MNEGDNVEKWDLRFLDLARFLAAWSKDPSTGAGACIVDADRRLVSMGYNGFAQGVKDDPERYADRETKYRMVLHAELNAILFARRDLAGCTLYTWPFQPCALCAAAVIQSGITLCVAPPMPAQLVDRWAADCSLARQMFAEVGVLLVHREM